MGKKPLDLKDKDISKKVKEVSDENTGYYSWIRINLLRLVSEHKEMISNLLIGTDVKNFFEKNKDDVILKVMYFTTVCMNVVPIEEYTKKFKKKDWEEHFIDSFNEEINDHQMFEEIKKILGNGI